MPDSVSALTFLGDKVVRASLADLWTALHENNLQSSALIHKLDASIELWEGSHQAKPISSSEPAYAVGNTSGQTVSIPDKTLLNADCSK